MMNIFFAGLCVYLTYSAIDYSFELVNHKIKFKKAIPVKNTVQAKIKINTEAKMVKAKIYPVVSNITKKVEIKKISKEVISYLPKYNQIDFTPRAANSRSISEKKRPEVVVTYEQVEKVKKNFHYKMKDTLKVKTKKIIKKKVKTSDLELSLTELPNQGKFEINKINFIAWSEKAFTPGKYANLNLKNIAKEEVQSDRISTANSATEKSLLDQYQPDDSKNFQNSPVANRKVTESTAPKKKDDLIFFGYQEPENSPKEALTNQAPTPIKKKQNKTSFDPLSIQKEIVSSIVSTTSEKNTPSGDDLALAAAVAKIKKSSRLKKPVEPRIVKNDIIKGNIPKDFNNLLKENSGQGFVAGTEKKNFFHKSKNYGCLDTRDLLESEKYKTKYELSLTGVDYSKKSFSRVRNFEVRFHDNHNETKKDYGEGVIELGFLMNTQISMRRGTFYSRGYYPTTVDLVFEAGDLKADIPSFTLETFSHILKSDNLRGLGAQLLVELDDKTEDVELDKETSYEAKLYLNKALKVVSRANYDYQYVLFIGVETGNTEIRFKNNKNKMITKLIHLAADEVYYEPNFYAEVATDSFAVYEERLLSKCKSMLSISASKVNPWSYDKKFTKQSLNKLKVSNMIYPLGTRRYYEFSHLDESIFVGRWSEENIIIPSEEYIAHVISKFDLSQSNSKCVVQLNISKPVREIFFNGLSASGNMNMQINILDKDGQFYEDFSEQSERVFLMGEQSGLISMKIEYTDKSFQYLHSYCSNSTYLVEQL